MSHIFRTIGVTSITDTTDASKILGINLASATTATTTNMNFAQTADRTWTWPDATSTVVGTNVAQTITNKTNYEPSAVTVTAAGGTQGTATALTNMYNIVTTVASGTGVSLPVPIQSGLICRVVNKGANTLNVYPASGGTIDAQALNAPFSLAVNGSLTVESSSTAQWYSVASYGIGGGAGVNSVTGTANQVSASPTTGAVIVSTPSTFIAPGTIQDTTGLLYSTGNGLTATGTNQGTALALTKSWNIVTTVPSGTGVIFPTPNVGGYVCVIINKGANILSAYPNSGAQIDTQAVNVAYQIAPNNIVTFRAASTTQWYSSAGTAPGSGLSSLLTEVNSGTTFTTTSATDVLITGMTYTIPIANPITRCLVIFNGSGGNSANGTATYSVYYNAAIVTNSDRNIQPPGSGSVATVATQAVIPSVSVGGVIEIRVRTTAGTVNVTTRSMAVLGVA